jgi:hypothetical protein
VRTLHLVSVGALLVATLDMPYGYYQLLRVGICIVSAFLAHRAFKEDTSNLGWVLAGTALAYNPVAPLALGRELWTIVNIATIGILVWSFAALVRQHSSEKE